MTTADSSDQPPDQSIDLLVFSPHPDDVELACSGSVILAVQQGKRVVIADLSSGEMSTSGSLEVRQQERQLATDLLGIHHRYSLNLPDTRIGSDPAHEQAVISLLRRTRPQVVLAPHINDRHPDHVAASELIKRACFFAGIKAIGTGLRHRPKLYYYLLHSPDTPSFIIDVSTVWEQRMNAMKAYQSQFFPGEQQANHALNQLDFLKFIEARAIWYGAMIGVTYGEAFYSPGPLPLDTLPSIDGQRLPVGALPAYRMYE